MSLEERLTARLRKVLPDAKVEDVEAVQRFTVVMRRELTVAETNKLKCGKPRLYPVYEGKANGNRHVYTLEGAI